MTRSSSRPIVAPHGDQRCRFCGEHYIYELEYRCVACDSPICPICVVSVRLTRDTFCPSCDPDEEGVD